MRDRITRSLVVVALTATAAVSAGAQTKAQTLASIDSMIADVMSLAAQSTASMTQTTLRATPGNSVGSESAWGAGWGDFFAGVGYQSRARFSSRPDGSGSFGFGLGNNRDLAMEVGISSASTFNETPGKNGSISAKIHRVFFDDYGFAVGIENLVAWGNTDGGSSTYGVVSHTVQLTDKPADFMGSLAWNVGVGNRRFQSEDDIIAGKNGVNIFGSAGLRLASRASLVGDWTGQDLDVALSLVPFHKSPLVLSLGVADVTRTAGNGPRFIVGLGAGFRVLDLINQQNK